jgi:hypothetical protein
MAAPNMIGNTLGAAKSVQYFLERTRGSVFINGTGSNGIINPHVADDNSPVPQDRFSFRYNYFHDALQVRGDSGQAVFDPSLGISQVTGGPRFRGILTTRSVDVHDYTFQGEKTFFNGWASVEIRVPFSNTLAHDQNISVARVTNVGTDIDSDSATSILQTDPTPRETLGHSDTEFGNMSAIFKALVYSSKTFAVSGGLGVGIPTAPDSRVRVTDFLGDAFDNDIEIQRLRVFEISNDTWSLDPFAAFLWTPGERFFTQGFLQIDVPLNKSTIRYSEAAVINTEPQELSLTPIFVTDKIREQTLMQTDLGVGYWVMRRGDGWLTGLAPTLELHYTTTLNDADIRTLPLAPRSGNLAVASAAGGLPEPNPVVGNLRNRLDILDLTVGATFLFSDRATVAAGFAFPLRQGDDRTFNWEFQFQVNYYFGGPRRPFAPPTF